MMKILHVFNVMHMGMIGIAMPHAFTWFSTDCARSDIGRLIQTMCKYGHGLGECVKCACVRVVAELGWSETLGPMYGQDRTSRDHSYSTYHQDVGQTDPGHPTAMMMRAA